MHVGCGLEHCLMEKHEGRTLFVHRTIEAQLPSAVQPQKFHRIQDAPHDFPEL